MSAGGQSQGERSKRNDETAGLPFPQEAGGRAGAGVEGRGAPSSLLLHHHVRAILLVPEPAPGSQAGGPQTGPIVRSSDVP